jgi:hypothetical protein
MLRDATELRMRLAAGEGDERSTGGGGLERCAPALDDVARWGWRAYWASGARWRARGSSGARIGIVVSEVLLAFVLTPVGIPIYVKAKKRTGFWHYSMDTFSEDVAKTVDGTN